MIPVIEMDIETLNGVVRIEVEVLTVNFNARTMRLRYYKKEGDKMKTIIRNASSNEFEEQYLVERIQNAAI